MAGVPLARGVLAGAGAAPVDLAFWATNATAAAMIASSRMLRPVCFFLLSALAAFFSSLARTFSAFFEAFLLILRCEAESCLLAVFAFFCASFLAFLACLPAFFFALPPSLTAASEVSETTSDACDQALSRDLRAESLVLRAFFLAALISLAWSFSNFFAFFLAASVPVDARAAPWRPSLSAWSRALSRASPTASDSRNAEPRSWAWLSRSPLAVAAVRPHRVTVSARLESGAVRTASARSPARDSAAEVTAATRRWTSSAALSSLLAAFLATLC